MGPPEMGNCMPPHSKETMISTTINGMFILAVCLVPIAILLFFVEFLACAVADKSIRAATFVIICFFVISYFIGRFFS